MKTVKLKENSHKILKWIQAQDIISNTPKNQTDIDAIIFKSLITYAKCKGYNLSELRKIIEEMGEDGEK